MESCDLTVETRVAGITFDNSDGTSRQALARLLRAGDPLDLMREPTNPFDPNAIALYAGQGRAAGKQLGYVPRTLAAVLGPLMDQDIRLAGTVKRVIKVPRHGLWTPPIWAVRIQLLGDLRGLALPVRTGLEPMLAQALHDDEDLCGDAPTLGGTRSLL